MKIKLNDILIIAFLVLISLVLKQIQFVPIIIALLFVVLGSKIDNGIKNLIYIGIATTPFIPFFIFFIFYIPFIVFGTILGNASFIKKYMLGYSATLVLRLIVYHSSTLHIPISEYFISILLLIFLSLAYFVFIRKNKDSKISSLKNLFSVNADEFKILLITLFFLFFVTHVMYKDDRLYGSNGTQIFTKQLFVIDSIDKYNFFPQYDPSIGMGEQLFLTDSPAHFTKDILILATIFLRNIYSPVLVYNAYSMFILWLVILAASLVLKEVLSGNGSDKEENNRENNSQFTTYFIILGSLAIGLSFQFIRILESFKSFSAHPINLLLIAMILSKPKKPVEFFVMAYLMLFSYMVHVIQSFGVFLFVLSIMILMYAFDKESIKSGYQYAVNHKLRLFLVALLFIGVMFGYTATGYMYSAYLREYNRDIFAANILENIYNYVKSFFVEQNTTPFSIRYPDLQRLDTKQAGFFLSVIGSISFLYVIFNFKNHKLKKARILNYGYLLHFLITAVVINVFNYFGSLEFSYRIVLPYSVLALAVSIAAFFDSFSSRKIKLALVVVFFAFLLHSFFYVRTNIENIHSDTIISGALKNEATFVSALPVDGRIITYGLFANSVDAGMASITGRYFTRYQYNLWSELNNIYEKVHTQHSFGSFAGLDAISGAEMRNYYILGGYKYLFLNLCSPYDSGQKVLLKMYPNYSTAIYRSQDQYGCLVFLKVNNATYADKISVLKNFVESVYKDEDGYKFVTISRLKRYGFDADKILADAPIKQKPQEPAELSFRRINPNEVEVYGDFKDNEWVAFKEEYFPRWKAYMDNKEKNKEVPVYPTNLNMLLIKTMNGSKILLEYDMTNLEKLFSFISLVAVIICSLVFVWMVKYET